MEIFCAQNNRRSVGLALAERLAKYRPVCYVYRLFITTHCVTVGSKALLK